MDRSLRFMHRGVQPLTVYIVKCQLVAVGVTVDAGDGGHSGVESGVVHWWYSMREENVGFSLCMCAYN